MDNNELLRRLRYALQVDDPVARRLFRQGGLEISVENVVAWRLKDDDDDYIACPNEAISAFLAGLIVEKRGAQEGKPVAKPGNTRVENNTVLKLVRIALSMRSDDVLACMIAGGAKLSASEVNALMRKPDSRNYRQCGDQVLRQFIKGVALRLRDSD